MQNKHYPWGTTQRHIDDHYGGIAQTEVEYLIQVMYSTGKWADDSFYEDYNVALEMFEELKEKLECSIRIVHYDHGWHTDHEC